MNENKESKEAILRSYLLINPIKSNRSISLNHSIQNKSIDTKLLQKTIENKKYDPILEYKARKKLCIKVTDYPITFQGKATLDISKTFTAPKNNLTPISYSNNTQYNNDLEFKTNYILKYAQNADNFYKLRKCNNLIRDEKKRNFDDIYLKLQKSLEYQSRIFFDDKYFDNNSKEDNINILFIKNMICYFYDFNLNINKFCNLLVNELKNEREQNLKLLKKNYEQNLKLTSKTKEVEDLINYLNKYDLSKKIRAGKIKEQKINDIKNKFLKKENVQLLSIFNLEEEITDLTELLDKNKEYYKKYKNTEQLIEEKKRQNDQMRFAYNKELHEKNIQFAIEKDKQNELMLKVEELDNLILKYNDESEKHKRYEIELQAQIKKLQMIIEEKIESIVMMNEELEFYIREYNKEKINHKHTFQALQTLENKIAVEREEIEKKEKKEEE